MMIIPVLLLFIHHHQAIASSTQPPPPPVILINGLISSKLYVEARNINYPKHLQHCERDVKFRKAWITDKQGGGRSECEFYLITPVHNMETDECEDVEGVRISTTSKRQPFGSLDSTECLYFDRGWACDKLAHNTHLGYFHDLIKYMRSIGYEEGENLFAAAYDWRYDPASPHLAKYYRRLKRLVEYAYEKNGRRVVLAGHSIGNLILLEFLNHQTEPEWRSHYLNFTINLAPGFGGTVIAIKELIAVEEYINMGVTVIPANQSKQFWRALPSTAVRLPNALAFSPGEVFLTVGNRSFHVANMEPMFEMMDNSKFSRIMHRNVIQPPDVPMVCLYGTGLPTPIAYHYPNSLDDEPEVTYENGDGRVTIRSLQLCKKWRDERRDVDVYEFPGLNHDLIWDSNIFPTIRQLLVGKLHNNEVDPVLRNTAAKVDGDKLCFSTCSHPTCPIGYITKGNTRKIKVAFTCSIDAAQGEQLLQQLGSEQLFLEDAKPDLELELDVPSVCVRSRQ